jgi:rhamnose utilization protein RhaD (predicted bifunctional aldolase and dehydrogenase)
MTASFPMLTKNWSGVVELHIVTLSLDGGIAVRYKQSPTLDLPPVRPLSARVGQHLNLVQAGGGNTSIKRDGSLWIRASGKWLINAGQEDMFLPVPLAS